ncbi:OpgC domain-containing protein [Bacillus sp. 1P02SD]|uniref:OpgC domain-containing protein n=1 Tax=Bacillus sp. 1P02SD TaxID=3132264 RepID=UPI0039A1FF7C
MDFMINNRNSKRENIFDFLRSIFMLFVFLRHFYLTIPGNYDYMQYLSPFAELFVGLAGFMVGMIYLYRNNDYYLLKRGLKILLVFYIVAIPFTIGKSIFLDQSNQPVSEIILKVILMMEDPTAINILRFYGLIFLMLPIILWFYRKVQKTTIISSIFIFFLSSILYYSQSSKESSFFISQTLMMLVQWQLFFVIGIKLGDLYKTNEFKKLLPSMTRIYFVLAPLALIIHLTWFSESIVKFPYTYGKLLNTFYLAPIYVFILCFIYQKAKGSYIDKFIRVVGRNSLFAFILSEIIRIGVIKLPITIFSIQLSEFSSFVIAIITSFILIYVIYLYEYIKKSEHISLGINKFQKLIIKVPGKFKLNRTASK